MRLTEAWDRLAKLAFRLVHRKKVREQAQVFEQARTMASLRLEQALWDMKTHWARREGKK